MQPIMKIIRSFFSRDVSKDWKEFRSVLRSREFRDTTRTAVREAAKLAAPGPERFETAAKRVGEWLDRAVSPGLPIAEMLTDVAIRYAVNLVVRYYVQLVYDELHDAGEV